LAFGGDKIKRPNGLKSGGACTPIPQDLPPLGFETDAFRAQWAYRSLWWYMPSMGAVAALGVFGQRLIIVPDQELVIVKLGSHPMASNAATDPSHQDFLKKLLIEIKA